MQTQVTCSGSQTSEAGELGLEQLPVSHSILWA